MGRKVPFEQSFNSRIEITQRDPIAYISRLTIEVLNHTSGFEQGCPMSRWMQSESENPIIWNSWRRQIVRLGTNFEFITCSPATTMAEPDALISLRQSILSKKPISLLTADQQPTSSLIEAAFIVLPQPSSANVPTATLPKATPTRLRKPNHTQTDPSTHPTDFYGLDAVYLAWSMREAATTEYMKNARDSGITITNMVAITEKQSVADWLEGRTDNHPNIVPLQGKQKPDSFEPVI